MDILLVVILFEGITVIVGLAIISTRLANVGKTAKELNERLAEIANLLKK